MVEKLDRKKRKKVVLTKYIVVFLASAFIFTLGIILGQQIGHMKTASLNKVMEDMKTDIASAELHYILSTENPCDLTGLNELASELDKMSNQIWELEKAYGKNNEDVLRLANYYSTLQIRHWILAKDISNECDEKYSLILFFYSNIEGECKRCEEQGDNIAVLREKDEGMYTYAFNINLNNLAFNTLKSRYNVSKTEIPVIIINDKKYTGFKTIKKLQEIIYEE
ncbi:MAG: hypothetical protein KJ767_03250 [Nanoarchaeota archaeon]|nr:hypothetical protein [Nanoarchaeota archaeon]